MDRDETNGYTSKGRFERIEHGIDSMRIELSQFRVDAEKRFTAIETKLGLDEKAAAARVSDRSYKWMRAGVVASFIVGVLSLFGRLVFG